MCLLSERLRTVLTLISRLPCIGARPAIDLRRLETPGHSTREPYTGKDADEVADEDADKGVVFLLAI